MYCNSCDIAYGFHAPDGSEQVILGINLIGIFSQEGKKIEFLGSEDLLFAVYKYSSCSLIDLDTSDLDNVILALALSCAHKSLILGKVSFYSGYELSG